MKPYDQILRDRAFHIDFRISQSAAGPEYYLIIDLDNESGNYSHTQSGFIIIDEIVGLLNKDSTAASWVVFCGVITAIDGTEATVVYPHVLAIHNEDTTVKSSEVSQAPFLSLDARGESDDLSTFVHSEVVSAVNTGVSLADISGVNCVPAVGDFVMKMERLGGAQDAFVHATIRYRTEP